MHGCKPGVMENKHCVDVSCDQWRTNIAWVKRRYHVSHVGVLNINKVSNVA